ncbi:MAG: YidC/Oxa1 family membrane protein insertase [Ruminococcaceae bacterium]|nr:YidC/Oxa1 family membrane protein insertase [Oscillospiraceae bacterium]
MEFITIPFGWLLNQLYNLTGNYGVSLILFAILVQIVLLPITAKSKKSMMKMTRIQPKLNAIREKYANDQQKQQEAIAQIQKEEGVGMGCGGCLWSFVPLFILIPLYTIIREPLTNMLGADEAVRTEIAKILNLDMNNGYWQITAAQAIFADPSRFADIPGITAQTLAGINFDFLGIPLGNIPSDIIGSWTWSWPFIGTMLVPLISAGSQILQTQISRKVNNSLVTNEKGVQDKEEAEKSQSAQTGKVMMWMMPIMSLFIGFSVPAALSLYWFIGGVSRTFEDILLTKKYRKIYDAEDAEKLKKAMEQEAIEAEKERIRAEKRAANPDGITENTSKKKLQKQQQAEEAAAKAAAKKEYDAKKGIVEEEPEEKKTLSGIADRPYCKGRAYDPNRYNKTEE